MDGHLHGTNCLHMILLNEKMAMSAPGQILCSTQLRLGVVDVIGELS